MSKASQRRLAEQQKRVEKLKQKSPHLKALVELEEMDPEDVLYNPVRYWTRVTNALLPDEPHVDHELLDAAFEEQTPFFEVLHEAVLFEKEYMFSLADASMLPGLVMGFDSDGWITGIIPQSPVFTPAAADGNKWASHFADVQSRTGQSSAGVEGWFWIVSSFEPGLPLLVLGVSKGGGAKLWIHIHDKWVKSKSAEFIAPIHAMFNEPGMHLHQVAKGALSHALEAGTIAKGSHTSEIPGTPNAVSTLVTGFAQPYVEMIWTLVDLLIEKQADNAADRHLESEAKIRWRQDLKSELANVQKLLAAERLVSSDLRKELRAKPQQPARPASPNSTATASQTPSLRSRLGFFFGQ